MKTVLVNNTPKQSYTWGEEWPIGWYKEVNNNNHFGHTLVFSSFQQIRTGLSCQGEIIREPKYGGNWEKITDGSIAIHIGNI